MTWVFINSVSESPFRTDFFCLTHGFWLVYCFSHVIQTEREDEKKTEQNWIKMLKGIDRMWMDLIHRKSVPLFIWNMISIWSHVRDFRFFLLINCSLCALSKIPNINPSISLDLMVIQREDSSESQYVAVLLVWILLCRIDKWLSENVSYGNINMRLLFATTSRRIFESHKV